MLGFIGGNCFISIVSMINKGIYSYKDRTAYAGLVMEKKLRNEVAFVSSCDNPMEFNLNQTK